MSGPFASGHLRVTAWLLPVFLSATPLAGGAPFPSDAADASPRVFLVTLSPGSAIWERFGHNALVIEDPTEIGRRRRVAFNWGTFDFQQPNFIGRFIKGRMLYSLSAWDADGMIESYRADNRHVLVQELALSPEQARRLRDRAWHHLLPENRDYRYDYYRDNCSTRIRDALDDAVGGELSRQLKAIATDRTFRWHTRRLTADAWHWSVALNFIMGSPIDAPLDGWDEAFLPERLAAGLRTVQLRDAHGAARPLVRAERVLHETTRPATPEAPPNRTLAHLLLGVLVGGLLVPLGWLSPRRAWARWLLALLVASWSLLLGVGGAIGVYGWLFTDHVVARYNLNLLAGSPLQLSLVVLAPLMLLWRRGGATTVWLAVSLAALALLSGPVGWIVGSPQRHAEVLALLLPPQLASAAGLWLAASRGGAPNVEERETTP